MELPEQAVQHTGVPTYIMSIRGYYQNTRFQSDTVKKINKALENKNVFVLQDKVEKDL